MSSRVLNTPNIISLIRLVLSFVLFGLIAFTEYWIAAAILFVVAVATDALDGYIARKYNLITVFGRILDPLVDKVIICGAFLFLQNVEGSGVSPWLTLAVVVRELYVTSLRGFYEQQGIDFSASSLGKWKMVDQCIAVTLCLLSLHPYFATLPGFLWLRDVFLVLTVVITLYSGYTTRFVASKCTAKKKQESKPPTLPLQPATTTQCCSRRRIWANQYGIASVLPYEI